MMILEKSTALQLPDKYKSYERYLSGITDFRSVYVNPDVTLEILGSVKKGLIKSIKQWFMFFRVRRFLKGYPGIPERSAETIVKRLAILGKTKS
jgi:hypothetical protein